ncbi:MAG: DUF2490 domain-containing protein [bacterium]
MLSLFIPAAAARADDTVFYNKDTIRCAVGKNLTASLEKGFFFSKSMQELTQQYLEAGLGRKYSPFLRCSLNCRKTVYKTGGGWFEEDRSHAAIILAAPMGRIRLEDRNRLEYRAFSQPGKPSAWRYRNYLKFQFPMGSGLVPYVGDEFFLENGNFNQNRVYAGFTASPALFLEAEAYYARVSTRSGGAPWQNDNWIGLNLRFTFRF